MSDTWEQLSAARVRYAIGANTMSDTWEKLSAIDVNEWTEKKGQFTYLGWTHAWAAIKKNYPESTYQLLDDLEYSDGTREVRCEVTIDGLTHPMWLPVTDHKNKAIPNPNAFDVNTARMRCLVKCLAMFGLGHYIYAGESSPQLPPYTEEERLELVALLANKDGFGVFHFCKQRSTESMDALFNSAPKGEKSKFKEEVRALYQKGNDTLKTSLGAIRAALDELQPDSAREALEELTEKERAYVNRALTEVELHQVQQLEAV